MAMTLLPREHGAYGQLALPVVTALGAAGMTAPALLLASSAVAAFVAHEPASILLGFRGPRAKRELRRVARRGLMACAGIAAATGTLGVLSMDAAARWSLTVPAVPALLLGVWSIRGHEKSWYGEVTAVAMFAGLAVPVSMAAGASARSGAAIALPFAVLFVVGTLAVRMMILRVRAGGTARATAITRRSAVTVAVAGVACLAWLSGQEILPTATLLAAAPGLALALAVVARPPRPTRLRAVGWTIVATAVFAAAVLVVAT
jgi:YwiC-like protein